MHNNKKFLDKISWNFVDNFEKNISFLKIKRQKIPGVTSLENNNGFFQNGKTVRVNTLNKHHSFVETPPTVHAKTKKTYLCQTSRFTEKVLIIWWWTL